MARVSNRALAPKDLEPGLSAPLPAHRRCQSGGPGRSSAESAARDPRAPAGASQHRRPTPGRPPASRAPPPLPPPGGQVARQGMRESQPSGSGCGHGSGGSGGSGSGPWQAGLPKTCQPSPSSSTLQIALDAWPRQLTVVAAAVWRPRASPAFPAALWTASFAVSTVPLGCSLDILGAFTGSSKVSESAVWFTNAPGDALIP